MKLSSSRVTFIFIAIGVFIFLLFTGTGSKLGSQTSCETPPTNGAASGWKQNEVVNVVIDPSFNSTQRQAILDQLSKWANAGGANVTFNEKTVSTAGPGAAGGGSPILFITDTVPNPSTAQGQTSGFAYNGTRGDSEIKINPGVTDNTAFIQVISHETGHTFGLADCMTCSQNSTAMTLPTSSDLNAKGGHDGPTQCDSTAAQQNGQYPTPTPPPSPSPPRTDVDGDGFAVEDDPADCNDDDPQVYPGSTTMCEAMDRNCNNIDDRNEPTPLACGSPILIDLAGNGFDLTNVSNGVMFNLTGVGVKRWSWTTQATDDAWLVLDRNTDNLINNGEELFGCITPQFRTPTPNGFNGLAEFDKISNGGNGDGKIDSRDSVFQNLRLWQDLNHNGISEPNEMKTLNSSNVASISLDYKLSQRTDQNGNRFRYRAKVVDANGNQIGRWAWDVFLQTEP